MTAVVLVVGLSAAGVMTLQIVAPESPQAGAMAPAIRVSDAYVDTAPVMPKVREVKVEGIDKADAREIPGTVTPRAAGKDPKNKDPKNKAPKKLAALSAPTAVKGYATVGVTWKSGTNLAEDQISVQVRTRTGSTWSGWTTAAYHDDHGPDAGTAEAARVRPGTDPVVVGDVDEVQMRAETTTGVAPADLELAIVDPGTGKLTRQPAAIDTAKLASAQRGAATTGQKDAAALMAMKVAPKPTIYSRAQWGANEALRDKSSLRYGTIKTGFIHHTVNANNYTPEQVPALIRGIYAYHTQSRGWSDIGYNFLVDRFGRIWEGRYGGVDKAVVGAHTLGYNEVSFAMSAIGNYDIAQPPQAVLDAYARLFAWKLSLYNIRADASHLWVKDRYLNAINGHRDVGQTACPGRYLYAKIPSIRTAAQAIQNRAQTPVDPANLPPLAAPAGLPAPTQAPARATAQPSLRLPARTSIAGSGWPDLVGKLSSGAIQITTTEGILGFAGRVTSKGPWSKMSRIAAVGDVTGDGRGDVLARSGATGIARIYPGDGRGHVRSTGTAPTKAFKGYDLLIGAGDFDNDGRNDVIARQKTSTSLMLFRGTGHGTFLAPIRLKKRWPYQLTVAAARFDGDKRPDLIAMLPGGRLFLVPGLGREHKLAPRVAMTTLPADVYALYAGGDLTGDKIRDLVVRRGSVSTIYAGTRTARLGQAYGPFSDLAGISRNSSGQLLGNGGPEAVGTDSAGRLVVVAGNRRRNVSSVITSNLSVPGASQVLQVGDWDHDGNADLITRESGGDQLVLRPGVGGGKFGRGRSLGTGWADVNRMAAVGDVTGDGYPDLLGRLSSKSPWTIFPGAGNNGFKAPVLAPTSLRMYNQIGAAAWPNPGWAFGSADKSLVALSGTTVPTALRTANGTTSTAYDFYVGVGDVNGDGVADLLAREKGTGVIWLLPGKTSGGFAPRVWVASGYAGYQLIG
ncbi:MAG TPA: FG-GAP-like repeat-containing protein [Marmoricola sp.]|nr:FG-GAP-like repeat-containing protein [Marmoricola sp.]